MRATFIDKDFINGIEPGAGLLVIDTNLQGYWELEEHRALKTKYPKTYKIYKQICMYSANVMLGRTVLCEEKGVKIALLFTKRTRKDSVPDIVSNFEKCLTHMLHMVPSDVFIYSSILSRRDFCFAQMLTVVNRMIIKDRYNWYICRKV